MSPELDLKTRGPTRNIHVVPNTLAGTIGALLLGHTRDADRIETLVRTEANVADIKERLLTGLV